MTKKASEHSGSVSPSLRPNCSDWAEKKFWRVSLDKTRAVSMNSTPVPLESCFAAKLLLTPCQLAVALVSYGTYAARSRSS